MFSLVVGLWLSFGAIAMAIISTAGIFPDFMAGGTIDLYFSKPISRIRLFTIKYSVGVLFALVQVSIFALGSYVVFGFRGHEWRSELFLMIPLIVLLYSYLFSVAVLLGVATRSTLNRSC